MRLEISVVEYVDVFVKDDLVFFHQVSDTGGHNRVAVPVSTVLATAEEDEKAHKNVTVLEGKGYNENAGEVVELRTQSYEVCLPTGAVVVIADYVRKRNTGDN